NGAQRIVEAVMIAERPHALADFFRRLTEAERVTTQGNSLRVTTPAGALVGLDPGSTARRYPGIDVPRGDGPRFVGYPLAVADLARAAAVLARNGIASHRHGAALRVAPADAHGAIVDFVAA